MPRTKTIGPDSLPLKDELLLLSRQIEMALAIDESQMKAMTYAEEMEHIAKYGHGALLVGDFVIKRR